MDFLTNDNAFGLFIMIVAPGFISLKIWERFLPRRRVSFADSLYEAVFYGVLNYFAVVCWFPPLMVEVNPVLGVAAYIVSLVIVPMGLPLLWKAVLSIPCIANITINPIPKAWDVFFSYRERCFMLVHIKNGEVVGGLYGYRSAASTYPETGDLYLQEIWELDDNGVFINPIKGSKGLLVSADAIDYIELFEYLDEGGKNA